MGRAIVWDRLVVVLEFQEGAVGELVVFYV